MSTPQRRVREIAWTREEILDAAERAFARAGYEATTMQDIAKEAGYTVPSLYAYFPGKQEIWSGLLGRLTDELLGIFDEEHPRGLTFAQRIELVVRRHAEITQRRKCALAIFFLSGPDPGARHAHAGKIGKRKGASGFVRFASRLEDWIEAHAKPAELGGVSAADAAVALTALLNGFFRRWLEADDDSLFGENADVIVRMFLGGLGRAR